MKSILATIALTALIVFPSVATAPAPEAFEPASVVSTVQTVTVSGSAGVNL